MDEEVEQGREMLLQDLALFDDLFLEMLDSAFRLQYRGPELLRLELVHVE